MSEELDCLVIGAGPAGLMADSSVSANVGKLQSKACSPQALVQGLNQISVTNGEAVVAATEIHDRFPKWPYRVIE
jgi:predicted flavoprotein YhiN